MKVAYEELARGLKPIRLRQNKLICTPFICENLPVDILKLGSVFHSFKGIITPYPPDRNLSEASVALSTFRTIGTWA